MIVEFSVKNFRSIKDLQTISFVKTGLKSTDENSDVDKNNISSDGEMTLLKTVGIYGANASGKSNIIRALEYFIQAIRNEASSESKLSSLCDPFLFQENAGETESYFQIVLVIDKKKYRYGFSVKRNLNIEKGEKANKEIVTGEWLYGTKEKNLVEYFTRAGNEVGKEKLPNNEKVPQLTYEHTLFLTHAAAFDRDGVCAILRSFFIGWTISNFTQGLEPFRWNTMLLLEKEKRKKDFLELLSSFNLNYEDVEIERDKNKPEQLVISHDQIFLKKSFLNNKKEAIDVRLNLMNNESDGTKKLFDIAGLLLRAFNVHMSGFIIIDEIDSDFHPSLLIKLIQLFNDPLINNSNAQLLFSSHDTNLMSPSIMRRDQFYFTEKREDHSTRVYSLADLKGIRNDADFAKQYLAGFYGALPLLQDFSSQTPEINEGTLEN